MELLTWIFVGTFISSIILVFVGAGILLQITKRFKVPNSNFRVSLKITGMYWIIESISFFSLLKNFHGSTKILDGIFLVSMLVIFPWILKKILHTDWKATALIYVLFWVIMFFVSILISLIVSTILKLIGLDPVF